MMRPIVFKGAKALPLSPNPVTASRNGVVTLHWIDGTPAPGTAATNANGEIGFRIERAPVNNGGKVGTYVQIGAALANATSFTDNTAGTIATWSYRVIAWNAAGTTVSTPLTVTTPPLAPSNLTATLQGPPPTIRLNWTDNANNETNFVVQQSVNNGAFSTIATLGANVVTFTTPTLTPGSTYSYQVQATNGAGASAFAGPTAAVLVPTVPSAPGTVTVTNGPNQGSSRSIVVTWTAGLGATGYVIQRSGTASFATFTAVTVGNVLTTTITGLTRNTNYYIRVQATNAGGSSAWTNGVPFPRLTNP